MKQRWQQLALRIDAMQLRERVFLVLTVIISCAALADTLWLSPAQTAHKQAIQRYTTQEAELQRLRNDLKSMAQPVDANKSVQQEIAEANQRLDAINQEIRAVAPLAEGGPAIEQALVQFLRKQDGLTLLGTGTLQSDGAGQAAAANAPPAPAGTPAVLSRRGLELTVAGSYADLVRYVRTLESALPTLRWGTLQLKTTQQTPEMTLQVFVVGVPP